MPRESLAMSQGPQGSSGPPETSLRQMAEDIVKAMHALGSNDTVDQWLDVERALSGALRSKWLQVRVMNLGFSDEDMEAFRSQRRWLGRVEWDADRRCIAAEWIDPGRRP